MVNALERTVNAVLTATGPLFRAQAYSEHKLDDPGWHHRYRRDGSLYSGSSGPGNALSALT